MASQACRAPTRKGEDDRNHARSSGISSIYGSWRSGVEDPAEETPEFVEEKMEELEDALRDIPSELKFGYQRAMEKCPHLVNTTAHKLMFLRSESFYAELAALRLVRYWNKRLDLFGEDRAYREIGTAADLATLKEDGNPLALGIFQLTNQVDAFGRVIMYDDPTKLVSLKMRAQRRSFLRTMWYVLHTGLLDCGDLSEKLQRNGAVIIIRRDEFVKGAPSLSHVVMRTMIDRKSFLMMSDNMFGVLPIKIREIHLCRPPISLFRILIPFIKRKTGLMLKGKIVVHQEGYLQKECFGLCRCCCRRRWDPGFQQEMDEALVRELEMYGIPRERLPQELGGSLQLDYPLWLAERRERAEALRAQVENAIT